jgi:hypothetical protein
MTATQKFEILSSLRDFIPVLLALSFIHLSPFPRGAGIRALVSILLAWVFLVVFLGVFYNPAGIAAGHEAGEHFPEGRFDNNIIASALLGGWILPAVVMGIYFLGRRSMRAQQTAQERRAQENARAS